MQADFKLSHIAMRVLSDLTSIHLCMIAALAISVLHPGLISTRIQLRPEDAVHYYFSVFLLLSLLFPAVFLLSGLYSNPPTDGVPRGITLFRGVALSLLLFSIVSFALYRRQQASQGYIPLFSGLAILSLWLPRIAKGGLRRKSKMKTSDIVRRPNHDRAVLILGGAGYIGSCLVRKLLAAGRKVRVMDSLIYGDYSLHDVLGHPNLEVRVGDCRKLQDVVAAVKDTDSVIHLAAIVGDPACEVDRQTSRETNYAATRMLIEVAKGNGNCRLIFSSSCSVYGATDLLMDEYSNVLPISLYAQTKVDSEEALLEARSPDFHPVILRLATVFGLSYRTRFDLIVNLLTAKAHSEGMITIFNGTQWRPFIHVQDVADGICQVLSAPIDVVSGETYNLGDSRMNFTLGQLAGKVLAEIPATRVEYVENSDRRNYRVSFEKIRNQIGFECQWTLEDGVREIKRAFESKFITDYRDARYSNLQFLKLCGTPMCKDELDRHLMAALANIPAPARQSSTIWTSTAAVRR
ncbi:MAG TPA: NAD-dependent epimerase/dehydratase family protein [Chthoniobacterales bacterium]|nr:NAD-dependent epimerase/dehydratase family protein [Chthoniobacterales bacterium]